MFEDFENETNILDLCLFNLNYTEFLKHRILNPFIIFQKKGEFPAFINIKYCE